MFLLPPFYLIVYGWAFSSHPIRHSGVNIRVILRWCLKSRCVSCWYWLLTCFFNFSKSENIAYMYTYEIISYMYIYEISYVYTCENTVANCCFLLHISRHMTLELPYMYTYEISYIYTYAIKSVVYLYIWKCSFMLQHFPIYLYMKEFST